MPVWNRPVWSDEDGRAFSRLGGAEPQRLLTTFDSEGTTSRDEGCATWIPPPTN